LDGHVTLDAERLDRLYLLLPEAFSRQGDRVRRFEQEAKIVSALNHPNIVTIHEIAEADSRLYIVMKHVAGEALDSLLKRGPVKTREALAIGGQLASALAAAHEAGIIHRDMKPANVMLRVDGIVDPSSLRRERMGGMAPTLAVMPLTWKSSWRTSQLKDPFARHQLIAVHGRFLIASAREPLIKSFTPPCELDPVLRAVLRRGKFYSRPARLHRTKRVDSDLPYFPSKEILRYLRRAWPTRSPPVPGKPDLTGFREAHQFRHIFGGHTAVIQPVWEYHYIRRKTVTAHVRTLPRALRRAVVQSAPNRHSEFGATWVVTAVRAHREHQIVAWLAERTGDRLK
jgi:hypothetical protein